MDATKWLTNVALAYHQRFPVVPVGEIYSELYARWCAKLPEIELIQHQDPERVRKVAGTALKRWALAYCQRAVGADVGRYVVHYGRGQIRAMLPALAFLADVTPLAAQGERVRVDGGAAKHEGNEAVAGYVDLTRGWAVLTEDQQRALAMVFVLYDEQAGYPMLMEYYDCSYDAARKRVERALSKLQALMGNERRIKVHVDLDAEIGEEAMTDV